MAIQPRSDILALAEAVHGAVDHAEMAAKGMPPETLIDFSANINPFGPSPQAVAALTQVAVDCYPDRDALALRSRLAQQLGISREQLIVGNGSGELLHWTALAYLQPGDTCLVLGPTYTEYARTAAIMGADSLLLTSGAQQGFAVDADRVVSALRELNPRLCLLCNPNNPTGQWVDAEAIRDWAGEFSETLFVVDEAYIEFTREARTLIGRSPPNLIVLRSLAKAYALAGLRIGYAAAAAEVIDALRRVRTPWSVNVAAQAAGVAALEDQLHLKRTLADVRSAKTELIAQLRSLGLAPLPSATSFFLVPVGSAARVRETLLAARILVRDCTSFGLPEFLRISTRRPVENAALVEALRQIL